MKTLGFILLLTVMTGCAQLNQKQTSILGEIQGYEQQLLINPSNASNLASLGERYYTLFTSTQNREYRDLSIKYNQAYLDLHPQQPKIQRSLYLAYFHKVVTAHTQESAQRLKAIYASMNPANTLRLNPPSIATYHYLLKGSPKIEELVDVLKQAIVEQPSTTFAYVKLARAYRLNEQAKMAQAVLMFAMQKNPDDMYLQAALGNLYMAKGKEKVCQGKHYNDLEKALALYNKILKVRPESAKLRSEMAEAYFYNGHLRLALQQYKKSHEFAKDNIKLLEIGSIYSILGKNDKAMDYFQQADDGFFTKKDIAVHHFSLEKWQKSLKYFQALFLLEDDHFYGRLLQSYAISLNDAKNPGKEKLQKFVGKHQLDEWETRLYRYRLGELTSVQLMEQADDACLRTEGYFYQALQAKLDGKQDEYKQLLDKALQEKIYLFTEYNVAKNLARQARL